MSLLLKRPRPSFAQAFADQVRDEALHWISKSEARIGPDAYKSLIATLPTEDADFKRLMETAMRGGTGDTDAFRIGSDLQTILDWPVDQELVMILARAIDHTMRVGHRRAVIAWVMETGTRFDRKVGDEIAYHGVTFNGTRSGKVAAVDRPIATATIVDGNGQRWTVLAENLVAA